MSKIKVPDWIDRDEDFVHRGQERSGWKDEHKSYTDYVLGGDTPRTVEGQVKEVYQLCKNRSDNMSTDGNHTLHFSANEETGHTDGKKVFVSTKVLDEEKTFPQKVDIMLGITTHEMLHIQHTDFPLVKKEIKNRFEHSIWNIIEDERIEHHGGEEYPGYADSLSAVKQYFFDEKYLLDEALKRGKTVAKPTPKTLGGDEDEEEEDDELPEHLVAEDPRESLTAPMSSDEQKAMEIYDTVFKFIRYPKYVDPEKVAEHETAIDDIKSILTPYPKTAAEAVTASKKVAKVIKKVIDDEIEDDSSGILEMLGGMMESMTSENEEGKPEESSAIGKYDYKDEYIENKDYKAVFRKVEANSKNFSEILNEVKGDARRLAQVLQTKTFSETKLLHGMRNGGLDDAKIIEAVHGIKTVYTQKIPKVSKSLSIALLIDQSGSMSGQKIRDAAKVAILIQETFRIFPIGKYFVYGFTSDHAVRLADGSYDEDFNTIFRYIEPGSGLDLKHGLGNVRAHSNNRDGHAIRVVAKRIREFTSVPMLYFIVSDGYPAGERYNGEAAMRDTRNAVLEVKKMKFFPIQIGIQVDPTNQKMMFDDFVTYNSSKQMVDDLRKLILKEGDKYLGV